MGLLAKEEAMQGQGEWESMGVQGLNQSFAGVSGKESRKGSGHVVHPQLRQ